MSKSINIFSSKFVNLNKQNNYSERIKEDFNNAGAGLEVYLIKPDYEFWTLGFVRIQVGNIIVEKNNLSMSFDA